MSVLTLLKETTTQLFNSSQEKSNFLPLGHGERVGEKSLGVSTLQATEPPYSVKNGLIK